MSRVGKMIVEIPEKVSIDISAGLVGITGPKGSVDIHIHQDMKVIQDNKTLSVERPSDSRSHRSLHGTTRQLIANGIHGVNEGFLKELEIRGVGYQANMQGKYLVLQLGYSHDIFFEPPEGIEIKANKTEINPID